MAKKLPKPKSKARWWGWAIDDDGIRTKKFRYKAGISPKDKITTPQHPLFSYGTVGEKTVDLMASRYGTTKVRFYKGTKKMFDLDW